jgi:hypothetical protein
MFSLKGRGECLHDLTYIPWTIQVHWFYKDEGGVLTVTNTAKATTTPYYVKNRVKQIRSNIDETKFLTSESFRVFLEKIVRGLSGDYTLKLLFAQMVCTDGKKVYVDPLSELLSNVPDLPRKTLAILGQVAHEFFHIMYTDFKVLKKMERKFKGQSNFRYKQIHESFNIIEDSAVELAGTNYYTGSLKEAIIYNNEIAFKEMPSLNELHAKSAPRLVIFKMACAMYCILGRMKGTIADPEIKELFKQAMPILEQGRLQPDSEGRYKYAKRLYDLMLPLIEEVEKLGQLIQSNTQYVYTKNNQISHGGESQQVQSAPQIKTDFQAANRQKTQQAMEQDEQQSGQQQGVQQSGIQSGMPQDEGQDDELGESGGSGQDSSDQNQSSAGKGTKSEEESENGAFQSGSGQTQSDDEDEISEETKKALKNLEEQLEDVRDDVAVEEFNKEEMQKRDQEIRDFAKTVKYSSLHNGIRVKAVRDFRASDCLMRMYQNDMDQVKSLVRSLSRQMRDIIKYNKDRKLSGLYSGKVNCSQLHRLDKKVFYQRKAKADEADLAVLVLVDESGSMYLNDRIFHARQACVVLYETCKALKIPFAVIGHWAKHKEPLVYHNHYVDFDSLDPKEKYNLMLLFHRDNTREGVSLKYAGEYLLQRPESDKILIAISDGDPYHPLFGQDYFGQTAQRDTGRVAKELETRGVKIYGVAIGDGKSQIKEIYTRNYIDIPNIQRLPAKLTDLIRRNLLK